MDLNAPASPSRCSNPCQTATRSANSSTSTPLSSQPESHRASGQPEGDQFYQTAAPAKCHATNPPRFGGGKDDKGTEKPGFFKKTFAMSLGVMSGIGLAIGVPLGLLQMAVGLIFHPLLITGLITMGIPALGMLGAWMLGREKLAK